MKIGHYLVLSTAHLHLATAERLNGWAGLPAGEQPLAVSITQCGWFVETSDDGPRRLAALAEELPALLAFGRAHGCAFILFDCDGPREPSLPIFPW